MLYQFLPRLSDDEYRDLEASIREHGVQVPIVVDEQRAVIDGHHRKEIAERLGVECPRRVATDLTDEQKRTLALSLNLHRRHLSRDQKRELVEKSLKADPHLSDRQHADRTGVDHKTVGARRGDLETTGEIPQSETRTSADGRSRPATQPYRPDSTPTPDSEAFCQQCGADEDGCTCDVVGDPEPEPQPDPRPEPTPRTAPRKPLPDQFRDRLYDVLVKAESLRRLTKDDRWTTNAKKLATVKNRNELLRIRDLLEQVINSLPEEEVTP